MCIELLFRILGLRKKHVQVENSHNTAIVVSSKEDCPKEENEISRVNDTEKFKKMDSYSNINLPERFKRLQVARRITRGGNTYEISGIQSEETPLNLPSNSPTNYPLVSEPYNERIREEDGISEDFDSPGGGIGVPRTNQLAMPGFQSDLSPIESLPCADTPMGQDKILPKTVDQSSSSDIEEKPRLESSKGAFSAIITKIMQENRIREENANQSIHKNSEIRNSSSPVSKQRRGYRTLEYINLLSYSPKAANEANKQNICSLDLGKSHPKINKNNYFGNGGGVSSPNRENGRFTLNPIRAEDDSFSEPSSLRQNHNIRPSALLLPPPNSQVSPICSRYRLRNGRSISSSSHLQKLSDKTPTGDDNDKGIEVSCRGPRTKIHRKSNVSNLSSGILSCSVNGTMISVQSGMQGSIYPYTPRTGRNSELNTTFIHTKEQIKPKLFAKAFGVTKNSSLTKINDYILVSVLGKGAWAEVHLGIHEQTRLKYAIKCFHLPMLDCKMSREFVIESLKSEIDILETINSPYVVKFVEALEDDYAEKVYIITELCEGGSFFSKAFWKFKQRLSMGDVDQTSFNMDNTMNFRRGATLQSQGDSENLRKISTILRNLSLEENDIQIFEKRKEHSLCIVECMKYFEDICRGLHYCKGCLI